MQCMTIKYFPSWNGYYEKRTLEKNFPHMFYKNIYQFNLLLQQYIFNFSCKKICTVGQIIIIIIIIKKNGIPLLIPI